jgi:hypothetical protein
MNNLELNQYLTYLITRLYTNNSYLYKKFINNIINTNIIYNNAKILEYLKYHNSFIELLTLTGEREHTSSRDALC